MISDRGAVRSIPSEGFTDSSSLVFGFILCFSFFLFFDMDGNPNGEGFTPLALWCFKSPVVEVLAIVGVIE